MLTATFMSQYKLITNRSLQSMAPPPPPFRPPSPSPLRPPLSLT